MSGIDLGYRAELPAYALATSVSCYATCLCHATVCPVLTSRMAVPGVRGAHVPTCGHHVPPSPLSRPLLLPPLPPRLLPAPPHLPPLPHLAQPRRKRAR
eukprot:623399-Rhodomonas_salina.2